MASRTQDFHLIESSAALERLARELSGQAWICVDTEFVRVKTYFPKLCLIQIGTPRGVWCIDTLACPSLEPIAEILFDRNTVKIFHSAQQDLEVLQQHFGRVPAPLFDTQVAAAALGIGDQISYREIVVKCCNVALDKSHTRTDWSRRPLTAEQLKYAADDVAYLRDVYAWLVDALALQSRLAWLEEDFSRMVAAQTSGDPVDDAWMRIRGRGNLSRRELAALKSLAAWRESEARKRDRPRRWILPDETLVELSRLKDPSTRNLSSVTGMSERLVRRHGHRLAELLHEIARLPAEALPETEEKSRPTAEEADLCDGLSSLIKGVARELKMTSGFLATRADILRLVRGRPGSRLSQGWRADLTRDRVAAYLAESPART